MYYYLTAALKRRLILELKDSFSRHPVYRKIVPFIQNRYAFDERPQFGIVVQGSSANKIQLDASNFVGTVLSHVMLAQVGSERVFPLEWVREDLDSVRCNGCVLTPPGVYYVEILSAPTAPGEAGSFIVDPLRTVTNEPILRFQTGFEQYAQLQNEPLDRTLRLYEGRATQLRVGTDYELTTGGGVRFLHPFASGSYVTADYRYPVASIGPVEFRWNTADVSTLPGVVLAFGKRSEAGQKTAVVVYGERVDAAQAYGGKHEVSFDLEIIARDSTQIEEIADLVSMYLWGEKRPVLAWEGIEITDVSMGGESEEPIDETGQDFQFMATMSVQLQADWEIHVPLPLTISRMEVEGVTRVAAPAFYDTYGILAGRNPDFERIT